MNFRQFYFAREFVRAGHQVLIVSSSYSHQFLVQPHTEGVYTKEAIEGVEYVWIKSPSFRGSADNMRILHWLVFTLRLIGLPRQVGVAPDVIIVSSPIPYPILPASRMARRFGARLVFEVRDIWPLSLVDLGSYSERHPFIRFTQWVEDFAYREADLVVSTMPKAYDHMKTRGLPPEKFLWVPNGMDPDGMSPTAERGDERSPSPQPSGGRVFRVCYAGSFAANCIALPLVKAAASLSKTHPEIQFTLIGKDSGGLHILREKAAALEATNIEFKEPVPRTEMQRVLAGMDLCVATTKASPLYRFGLSLTKLADYMMAGKPIILSSNASEDVVSSSGCGVIVPPEDPKALADAIVEMAESDPAALSAMGERGRKEFLASYTLPALAAKYLAALDGIPR